MEVFPMQTHKCQLCHRCYKRPEHLKRHLVSHNSTRPHTCSFCGRGFQRSDALKRHLQNCSGYVNTEIQVRVKRRACDRCVRMKKGCDLGHPCWTCSEKQACCTYSSLESAKDTVNDFNGLVSSDLPSSSNDTSKENRDGLLQTSFWADLNSTDHFDFSNITWNDFLNFPSQIPDVRNVEGNSESSLHFLDNFTKCTGFTKSFDCGTLEQRKMVLDFAKQLYEPSLTTIEPHNLHKGQSEDPLAAKTYEMVSLVKDAATNKARNSPIDVTWSSLVEQMCYQFFASPNVRKFLELYWSVWHPNVNIVHRAKFNASSSKAVLVAAMVIIGACISPEPADKKAAMMWFNCVEEMVFVDDDFCDDDLGTRKYFPSPSKIQSLQAAYMVCLYQNWEGSDRSKRRIRRHRFSTLVAVARDIGIERARHLDYLPPDHVVFDWDYFVATEELIRVFLWTFLLDTAFVIFNNLPPRMVIREMNMSMASCEAVFQSSTAEECYTLLRQQQGDSGTNQALHAPILLHEITKSMCKEETIGQFRDSVANLGPLNLFVVTSAFHSLIFQHQNSFGVDSQLISIRNALENWKTVWTLYVDRYSQTFYHMPLSGQELGPENMWKRMGFIKHASEYWLLASLILDRMNASDVALLADDQITNVDIFDARSRDGDAYRPALQKYDETSMRQVNDLIADFQRTQIN